MQIVIDIPEKTIYSAKAGNGFGWMTNNEMAEAIKNGTPLPKGHGRLIDASYLLNLLKCEEYESCTWKNCSDCNQEKFIRKYRILEAPTIIEADKEDE